MCYFLEPNPPGATEPLFLGIGANSVGRLTKSGLGQILQGLGKRANVENCNPHTFRRTFAVQSLRNGMNIYHLPNPCRNVWDIEDDVYLDYRFIRERFAPFLRRLGKL